MKKITFKTLSITNFLSIGKELVIPLDKGGISIITGYNFDKEDGNGVGKSAIVDAFFFVLFGETLKDLKKEEIVNDIAKKGCKVMLEFDIDMNGVITPYRIERGLAPSFCKIFINGEKEEDKTLSTIPVTNNFIRNLINSTPAVFRNTITMCLNNTIPFMGQKKNERREFIEGILRLELFKIMNKVAKENYDVIFKDYDVTTKSHEDIIRNIQIYYERKDSFEKNRNEKNIILLGRKQQYLNDIEALRNRKVNIDQSQYQKLMLELTTINKEIDTAEKSYSIANKAVSMLEATKLMNTSKTNIILANSKKLKEEYDKFPTYDNGIKSVEDCKAFIEKTLAEIDADKASVVEFNRDIRDQQQKIQTIQSTGSFCDKCNRPFPDNDIKKNEADIKESQRLILVHQSNIASTLEKIDNKKKMISKAEVITKIMSLNAETTVIVAENESVEKSLVGNKEHADAFQKTITELKAKQQAIQTKKDELQTQINSNASIDNLIQNHQTNLKYCENDLATLATDKNEFIELITASETYKTNIEKKIEEFKEQVAIYDVIKFVVSDEGVKAFIIKKRLNVLNERIAYYLVQTDANCKMIFDEYFDVKIINDKKNECSYENFSNGERKRIDLACLFAFKDLRRIQGDIDFNLSFYDELLDSALSSNASEKVFNILKERVDKYKEAALVITHKKENLKSPLINDIIYLEKSGGITKLGKVAK